MHTLAFKSCRIHHNGDFTGDIYIGNIDNNSEPVGKITEIKFTVKGMLDLYNQKDTITIKGIPEDGYGEEITILRKDLESFILAMLIDKIHKKIDSKNVNVETIVEIAKKLNIDCNFN